MRTQKSNTQDNKLRQRLKTLFKKENIKLNGQCNTPDKKIGLNTKHLQPESLKGKKNFKTPNEEIPPKKKRKLVESELKKKAESNPESKKLKIKTKSVTIQDRGNEKAKSNQQSLKCANGTAGKKDNKCLQNNEVHLPVVQCLGSQNGRYPEKEESNVFDDDEGDYSFDDSEYDDEFDSYSDDYSSDSEDHFQETDSCDDEEFDYSDSDYDNLYGSETFSETDPDYELPKHIPEDLIIHKAHKYDLDNNESLNFDSDNDNPQIYELRAESTVKVIKQPEVYEKNALLKLNENRVYMTEPCVKQNSVENSENECPELVPITNKDAFQLYSSESDYSGYEEISSDSSIPEEDINQKYINFGQNLGRDFVSERIKGMKKLKSVFNMDIINVKNCIPLPTSNIRDMNMVENEDGTEIKTAKVPSNIEDSVFITVRICDTDQTIFEEGTRDLNAIHETQCVSEEKNVDASINYRPQQPAFSDISAISGPETLSQSTTHLQKSISVTQEHTNFRTKFFNAVNSNLVLVLAKDPFYLYGTLCMTLLAGKVEIYGYSPRLNEECEIFSPRGCCSVQITTLPCVPVDKDEEIRINLKPLQSSFSSSDLESIEKEFESSRDAVLLLNRNTRRKKLKNIFKKYMNENVFPNMNSIQPDRPFYASEYLLDCVINTETERELRVPQEWRNLYFTPKSKVLLAGGKSVGKSTLLRYLLNCQLEHCERVLVIDLDIGQAELFIPQTVSCTVLSQPLLGPGFFHNHQPTRAYVVGHSNIVLCAQAYVRAIKKLVDFCYSKEEFAEIPWLVNTMGYNKGFGMELMSVISQLIRPTDIVQLQSNRDINNFDELLYPHVLARIPRNIYTNHEFQYTDKPFEIDYRLHVLCSAILQESRYQRDWEMSAKDLRYVTFLSRLSDVLQGNAEWLTDCVPYSALIENLHIVNMVCNESTREESIHALEANIVYLCRKEGENSGPVECVGIGIVRAIDLVRVYLLPAMAYDYLKEVNCLALGEMPLPSSLFSNQGPKVRGMSAFLYNTVDARTSKSIKQIYRRPSHFLSGKHKNVLND
ncbi:polynucleotide 5'-hydroxyl-kinase NOL9 isoform X2 [Anastrepha ludens]|uniref:polynucleotide 5'-hydroxyl-kinase NOL9 isoform X2 n=1 Tax=Anastrepha ludens TaxID=28586 RepID=UPI0023AFA063|nr:polynucleotide 5'-hydroxyl-kinase NOL9 isoform X2 [Anastrepha ludens]